MDDIRDVKVAFMVTLLQSVDSILWQIACNSVMNFLAWEQIISSECDELYVTISIVWSWIGGDSVQAAAAAVSVV